MNLLNAAQRMQMIEKFETLTMNEYGALNSEIEQLRQRVQELEKDCDEYHQVAMNHIHANEKLTAERDALKQQRDELFDALEYVIEDLEVRARLKEDEDERGVVDIGDGAYNQAKSAIASVKEKQDASD